MRSSRLRTQCKSRDIYSTPRMHGCSQNLNKELSDAEVHVSPFILTCWIQQNLDCGKGARAGEKIVKCFVNLELKQNASEVISDCVTISAFQIFLLRILGKVMGYSIGLSCFSCVFKGQLFLSLRIGSCPQQCSCGMFSIP